MKFIPNKPHFFQPVLPNFKHGLSIPISFIKRYLKEYTLKHVELRRGNRKWGVKVKKERVLEEGWLKFVEDNNVNIGDFLVFKHKGYLVFEVLIFDKSALLKPFSHVKQEKVNDDVQQSKPNSSLPKSCNDKLAGSSPLKITCGGGHGGHPYFTSTLSLFNINNSLFYIPMKFARTHGLLNKCEIEMRDEKGRSFPMALKHSGSHVKISKGFYDFHTKNGLKDGDSVIIHLLANGNIPILNLLRLNSITQKKQQCNKVVFNEEKGDDIKAPYMSKICKQEKGKEKIRGETSSHDPKNS